MSKKQEIYLEETEKVLREVTEDEMRVLEDVLDDLNPANLPLNDLFSGKMRVVIPFPTTDPSSELGKFAEFFRSQEYDVDWEKGMVYAERDMRTSVIYWYALTWEDPNRKEENQEDSDENWQTYSPK